MQPTASRLHDPDPDVCAKQALGNVGCTATWSMISTLGPVKAQLEFANSEMKFGSL